ncbi:UNVERIFIED_CONTAM: hypothetical protein HDU68_001161 [Siphonaria sp. JEL0065]|nr:hypothetical protein HDU68_001161 [Siphonaria sp. JEL0065]
MTPNINISSISCTLLNSLPPTNPVDSSQTVIGTSADLLFALLHAYLQTLGFRLNPATENTSNNLPPTWNATPESYSLKYSHERSSLSFVLKGVVLADKLLVHCVAVEDGSIYSLEYSLQSTFKDPKTSFPLQITIPSSALVSNNDAGTATEPILTADENPLLPLFKDGVNGVEGVLYQFKTAVVDKVAPNLNKEGYEAAPSSSTNAVAAGSGGDRLRDYGRGQGSDGDGGWVGGIPDPEARGGGGGGYGGYPGIRPGFGTGDIDLDPFGAAPGVIPPRGGFGGMHPGGGMYVGPDHPMFGGGGSGGSGGFGGGIYGGPGAILPPGAVPPNARFDPIGSFGGPPMGPGGTMRGGFGGGVGGIGNPFGDGGYGGGFPVGGGGVGRGGFGGRGRGRGGGPGGFRMGPDNDDMPPPGFGDDMYS